MLNLLRRLWKDEEGQGMVEYGLIIALVAIFLITALGVLSGGVEDVFNFIGGELTEKATE
jgi:pilus assembly protein Flp/PilA